MDRLPPLLRIPRAPQVKRHRSGEDTQGDRGTPQGRADTPAPSSQVEDAVSERAASLAERLDALETPPSARSLREARALLTHQPALAQQAQGECVDRDNATKIL